MATTVGESQRSGEYTTHELMDDIRREAIAVTDFINDSGGGYRRDALDPVATLQGRAGSCFTGLIIVAEEISSYLAKREMPGRARMFIGWPSWHGRDSIAGTKDIAHTTLFTVDTAAKAGTPSVIEANIMAYHNIPPSVDMEIDMSNVLTRQNTSDLTVVNNDELFLVEHTSTADPDAGPDFAVYEYEEGVEQYLAKLGRPGLFSFVELREMLERNRHLIPGGIINVEPLPVQTPSGIDLPLDADF